jgi:hypothetical protein
MSITIKPATGLALQYILDNLSEMDRIEMAATNPDGCRLGETLIPLILERSGFSLVAWGDRPITACGLVPLCPGVAVAFAFSTPEYRRAIVPVTRFIRGFGTRVAIKSGLHRIEFRALAARPDVERWVALLGAKPEATLSRFGKNGEDFILYRWLAHEHAQPRHDAREASRAEAGCR